MTDTLAHKKFFVPQFCDKDQKSIKFMNKKVLNLLHFAFLTTFYDTFQNVGKCVQCWNTLICANKILLIYLLHSSKFTRLFEKNVLQKL